MTNLQLAQEIRDSIGRTLEDQGDRAAWESLRLFLERADRQGILVDVGLDQDPWPATA